jgi:hypothetical protein
LPFDASAFDVFAGYMVFDAWIANQDRHDNRLHQSLQNELLTDHGPFESIEAQQAALDAWRQEYNTDRPHQFPGDGSPGLPVRSGPVDSFQLDIDGETIGTVPRTTSRKVHRYKAYATHKPGGGRTTGPGRAGKDEPVKPNLARIPAAGDALAEAITRRAGTGISQSLLDSLDDSDAVALGRYGARQPSIALRQKSAQRLEDALFASALAQLVRQTDPRDLMVGMAVHFIVAEQIGAVPSVVFEDVASRLPDGPLPDLVRQFGDRQDITLEAFGWQLVQTPEGPDFVPA